jgi:glutamyl endopeptidase
MGRAILGAIGLLVFTALSARGASPSDPRATVSHDRAGNAAITRHRVDGRGSTAAKAPIAALSQTKRVFGSDDRYFVPNTTRFPFSCVCKVFASFPDGSEFIASGIMVGRSQMLTAGHVVHDNAHGGWAELTVAPGYDNGAAPLGVYENVSIKSFSGWIDDQDFDYDMAFVELDGNAGDFSGWLGLRAPAASKLRKSKVTTAGFPGDINDGDTMVYAFGRPSAVGAEQIYYRGFLDTFSGQSGSGVWTGKGAHRVVVGVHSWESELSNGATRLSRWKLDQVVRWKLGL